MLTFPHFEPTFERARWTLGQVLEHQAATRGDKPFMSWEDEAKRYSFAEVNAKANQLARGFQDIGVKKGDVVVLFMPNSVEFVFAWFALNKLGAVEAPMNTGYKGKFLEHQINIAKAKTIVVAEALLGVVTASLENLPNIARIIVHGDAPLKAERHGAVQISAFSSLWAEDDSNLGVDVRPQDIAAIMFTSGTTGLSKGVLMPHAQNYLFSEINLRGVQLDEDDVYLIQLPLFHANSQLLGIYPCLIAGARFVLYERFSASQWIHRVHASGATVTNSLGVMLHFIYAQPPSPLDRTHRLRRIFAGPTPYMLVDDFAKRFGVERYADAFGQTEICLPIMNPLELNLKRPPGAAGLLLDQWFDVRIVDPETDEDVPVGEVGELVLRHKYPWTINAGYVSAPEKAAEAWRNLWFHTGDALRRDADGWYYFVDRLKDALRRRGENISSFEVESAISEHPAVADVAVVAVPAGDGGGEDEVKACIVLNADTPYDPKDLVAWCEERLPAFAVPRFIEVMAALPRTPSEKIIKADLRRAGVTAATWDRTKAS